MNYLYNVAAFLQNADAIGLKARFWVYFWILGNWKGTKVAT